MQKTPLHPLRLVHLDGVQVDNKDLAVDGEREIGNGQRTNPIGGERHTIVEKPATLSPGSAQGELRGDAEAQQLLKRTPQNYMFSQAYGLWLYISLFLLTILITHTVSSTKQYGVFAEIQTAINTIIYIISLGLEDATATFVPRVFAEHGRAAAARLIRSLLSLRLGVLAVSFCVIIFGLPILASLVALVPVAGSANVATGMRDPALLAHTWPIAGYVVGSGVANLLMAVCAALMRMYRVFIIGSATQLAILALAYVALSLGWGIDGVLWMQAVAALLGAAGFVAWLTPLLALRRAEYTQPLKPVLQLGMSAWITNLVSGALLKQVSIILLVFFTAALADTYVAYFNLSFQMADAANILLVAGFSGVGAAALSAAFVGRNSERMARTCQVLIKVETLIAAPGLVFCLFNAQSIASALYGNKFSAVGPLLAIFLFFNILVRILGTTIHQSSLYVIGKPRLVVLSQWISLLIVILGGIALIPAMGPAGALIADGVAKMAAGACMLLFLVRTFPRKYPIALLGFTGRFLLVLVLAALPGILWHPTDRVLLVLSAVLFIVLCLLLLLLIKPLDAADMEMISRTSPRFVPFLRRFAR
jgi:O-antigen/teichoic acid export membrane protein